MSNGERGTTRILPADTRLTMLVGLLVITVILSVVVALSDPPGADGTALRFLPAFGSGAFHAQLRFALAIVAMGTLLLLLHILGVQRRTRSPLATLARDAQSIAGTMQDGPPVELVLPDDPALRDIADAVNRLSLQVADLQAQLELRTRELAEARQMAEAAPPSDQ